MKGIRAVIFAAVVALGGVCAAEGAHYAVNVGVNEYDTSYVSKSDWLAGCVADANGIWADITGRGEWTQESARKLLDSAATKAAIREAITNIASIAEAGDVFLYTHSSHGYNKLDENEEYTLETGICTYDADYDDYELAADLAKFKSGVKVVVMVDACHSGGLFKGKGSSAGAEAGESSGFSASARRRVKSAAATAAATAATAASSSATSATTAEPVFDIAGRVASLIDTIRAKESRTRALAPKGIESSEIGWITAADYNQYSWDYDDGRGGAFTMAVLRGWEEGYCDDQSCGNEDNHASFYELWNYARKVAVGGGEAGTSYYTQAQCANEEVLQAVTAGWVGSAEPPGADDAPRLRSIGTINADCGEEVSFYARVFTSPEAPATLTLAAPGGEGQSATIADGWFHFAPGVAGEYSFVLTAENKNGTASETFTVVAAEVQNAEPSWERIPMKSAQVQRPFRLDLAQYLAGSPAPTLEIVEGDEPAEIIGTVLAFTPSELGRRDFVVCASNELGTASAAIAVEAGALAPKKFALCVGINKYEQISRLWGCVNDAKFMAANLVERGGWDAKDVTILLDAAATKGAIRGAISNIVAQAMAGDTFVYQHSSHGLQVDSGGGGDEKATGLCVYDENYWDDSTGYNDYEIAEDLAGFASGVKVAMIVDACYSGGLFKSREAALEAARSFNLAGRVSAAIEARRTRSRARGEDAASTISADEIGWATACEYDEQSLDGGFYHTGKWLEDASYDDEYWIETGPNDGYYDYPGSYRIGGAFLASATWGWWSGAADTDEEAGDNDGCCDVYELWKKGYDFCSKAGEFWYDDSDDNYYPQCTNVTVLRSIELGWTVPAEPYPALGVDAEAETIAAQLAGSADSALVERITNAATYRVYRNWAGSVKAAGGAEAAGVANVRSSPRAWLSFALASDTLLARDIVPDDISIANFAMPTGADGGFALEVAIDGVSVGSSQSVPEAVMLANLAEAIRIEGAEELGAEEFDAGNVDVGVLEPEGGKARFEAVPAGEEAKDAFFFRVKIP